MTLHIVNKSPDQTQCLKDCLRVFRPGDGLLLIEDAVYGALVNSPYAALLQNRPLVYALIADIEARGLSAMDTGSIKRINDKQFVDLTVQHSPVQSWY